MFSHFYIHFLYVGSFYVQLFYVESFHVRSCSTFSLHSVILRSVILGEFRPYMLSHSTFSNSTFDHSTFSQGIGLKYGDISSFNSNRKKLTLSHTQLDANLCACRPHARISCWIQGGGRMQPQALNEALQELLKTLPMY